MALDIIIHHDDGSASRHEFPEGLHQAIFNRNIRLKKNNALYPLKDYYLTDCSFKDDDISRLACTLEAEKTCIDDAYSRELKDLISLLRDVRVLEVAFTGD